MTDATASPETAPETTTVTQTRTRCRHIHAAGHQCGSPALRKRTFCYYHDATHRPHPNPRSHRFLDHNLQSFTLPVLEDHRSVLLALSQIAARIAANDLDPKRAHHLLEALRITSIALAREARTTAAAPPRSAASRTQSNTHATESPTQITDPIFDPSLGPLAPESAHIEDALTQKPLNPSPCHSEHSEQPPHSAWNPIAALRSLGVIIPDAPEKAVSEIGRDFSPGITVSQSTRASAPGTCLPNEPAQRPTEPAPAFALASSYPQASASGISSPPEEEGALAPGVCLPPPSNESPQPTCQLVCLDRWPWVGELGPLVAMAL